MTLMDLLHCMICHPNMYIAPVRIHDYHFVPFSNFRKGERSPVIVSHLILKSPVIVSNLIVCCAKELFFQNFGRLSHSPVWVFILKNNLTL